MGFASHVVALGDRWGLWRWACLRATGFPAELVLELASAELAAAADQVIALDDEIARRRDAAIAACNAADARVGPDDRRSVQRALKRLAQRRVPEPIADPEAEAARQALAEAVAAQDTLSRALSDVYARAQRVTAQTLQRRAGDDRFRQALLWQNPSAVRKGVDWLRRHPLEAADTETSDDRTRRRANERLVAGYLQRYCVKNDTIGFFGPVGWARLGEQAAALVQRPGASLLASRTVYFEYWAIDALAARLADDPDLRPDLRPFLVPRRAPGCRLDGTTLHYPIERRSELPAEFAAVLARCDGERTARDIARAVADEPGLADEADVFDVLDELVAARVAFWALEIPTAVVHPERALAARLAAIEDDAVRRRAEDALATLERGRTAVAASTDAAQLEAALTGFAEAFTAATEADSQRAHGKTYAGRTPLYEDCRRDLEVELGQPFLDRLGPPLALLLDSARWYSHEIAARYRQALTALFHRLRSDAEPGVDFARFWRDVPALFPGGAAPGSIVGEVRAELQRRWAQLLACPPGERAVQRRADALRAEVERAFAAPGPGWPAACYHSPDVMIAAAGPDAIARGDYRIVIGEIHTGFNTITEPLFLKQHPDGAQLVADRDADVGRVCIAPVWSKALTRGDYYSMSPRDLDLEVGDTRSARPRDHVVTPGELIVVERDGRLEVQTRDGARQFDVLEFFEHHVIAESFAAFSVIASAPFTPRITIDDVVIARATWRFTPSQLTWPGLDEPAARFVAARRWARGLGMPRWVFVKTAEEVKPVFVDFDSTVYVEMLAKQLRGASAASLSEMLPGVDQAWVIDRDGARYTAELRIAAVDAARWQPPEI